MKAISLRQPWASMIADGQKTMETRMWRTDYRGDLLIVASKKPKVGNLPTGEALCVVRLVDCRPMTDADELAARCPNEFGRYAWLLKDLRPVEPFPVHGRLKLYDVDNDEVGFFMDCKNCNGMTGGCHIDGSCVLPAVRAADDLFAAMMEGVGKAG